MQKTEKLTPFESRFCNNAEAPGPFTLGYLDRNSASCARSTSISLCNQLDNACTVHNINNLRDHPCATIKTCW